MEKTNKQKTAEKEYQNFINGTGQLLCMCLYTQKNGLKIINWNCNYY